MTWDHIVEGRRDTTPSMSSDFDRHDHATYICTYTYTILKCNKKLSGCLKGLLVHKCQDLPPQVGYRWWCGVTVPVSGYSKSACTCLSLHQLYRNHVTSQPVGCFSLCFHCSWLSLCHLLLMGNSVSRNSWLYWTENVAGSSDEGHITLCWILPHSAMVLLVALWPRGLPTASVPRAHSEWPLIQAHRPVSGSWQKP